MSSQHSLALIETPYHDLIVRFDERGLSSSKLVSVNTPLEAHVLSEHKTILDATRRWVEGYFMHQPSPLPPLDLSALTSFQQRALKTLTCVPFGERISYQRLAERVGSPQGARAVGGAMASNPLPLLIPCHRVTPSNGSLGQYSGLGGVETKQCLLAYESQDRPFLDYLQTRPIFRVITAEAWHIAQARGVILPSPLDERDGFIHLSTKESTLETARRYFTPQGKPIILELSPDLLSGSLRWEEVATRGYQLFPHLYSPSIPLNAVISLTELTIQEGQLHLSRGSTKTLCLE